MIPYSEFVPDAAAVDSVARALGTLHETFLQQGRLRDLGRPLRKLVERPDAETVYRNAALFCSNPFVMLYAAETDCVPLFRLRVEGLANPGGLDFFLHVAGRMDAPEVIRYLGRHGADLNSREDDGLHRHTALHWAVYQDARSAVVALLEQPGLDLETLDGHGTTALDVALRRQAFEVAGLLLAAGARLNPETALLALGSGSRQALDFVLAHVKDLDFLGPKTGMGPLHAAVASGDAEAVARLLEAGADASLQCRRKFKRQGREYPRGATALDCARIREDAGILALLE